LDVPEEVFPIFLWVSGIFEKAMEGERERGLVYEGLVIYPLVSTSQGPLACFFLGCGLPSFNCNPELPSPSFFGRTEVDPLLQL
jgi:hypothetical protein